MMTLGGTYLTATNNAAPSLLDMAVGLSRIPRFGGQTLARWAVTDHLLSGALFLKRASAASSTILHWSLHDAHETFTEDIPSHFKTPDTKALQASLDERIYKSLGLDPPTMAQREIIKSVDQEMLLAEAYYVTPAATYWRISEEVGGWGASAVGKHAVRVTFDQNVTAEQSAQRWLLTVQALIVALVVE